MILATILSAAAAAGPGSLSDIWQHIVADFSNLNEPAALAAFGQVLLIDLVLAGDNAIVVGALAAGLPAVDRRKVIGIGIGAALVLRIFFALIVTWLMGLVGLIFAGGLLLLSVALMGLAANLIARIINKHRWIAYIGLAVIVFVAGKMIYEGWTGTAETAGIVSLF